jgi:Ca-activated chloride channel family protein
MRQILGFGLAVLLLCAATPGLSRAAGLLKPNSGKADAIHIQSHTVHVTLNNGFARTEVDQVFKNNGDNDLEATYSFPLPKQASLSELSLWINGQEIVGEVLEKQRAVQAYETQKQKGHDVAMATKNDYKTFDVRVYPVRAHGETRVRLVYYQPLEIDLNVGRYVYPLAEGNVDEERICFWSVDDRVQGTFKFSLSLKSAFPVKDLRLPGYQDAAQIRRRGAESETEAAGEIYDVSLEMNENADLSHDIVFYYRLDDTVPARVEVIPYRANPNEDGTFMVVVTPGASLQPISQGADWTFVLDVSGSMKGDKITTLVDGVRKVIAKMSPSDRYRIVTFNERAHDFSGGFIEASPANVQRSLNRLNAIQAGGSTALYAGLEAAYNGLDNDRTQGLIIVTDGVANVGPSKYADLMQLHRRYDVRLFTFIIGNSANQPLLGALAKESGGFAMNISTSDDVIGRIMQAKTKLSHEAIYDVKLAFSGERVKDLTPAAIGNLYAGQQVLALGRYSGGGPAKVTLSGRISGEKKKWQCMANLPETDEDNPEIERIWALSHIEAVMDEIRDQGETDARIRRVTDIATEFSLVTDYTAMIVLNADEAEGLGIDRRNADRVHRERQAQARRAAQPVKHYRVDTPAGNGSPSTGGSGGQPNGGNGAMFGNNRSAGLGSGPVGPLFLALAYAIGRRRKKQ